MTNVARMHQLAEILRRHGLTLLLTSAMVVLYLRETMPAVHEHNALRARRVQAEAELALRKQALSEALLWLRGATEDPFVQARFRDAFNHSPDLNGPRVMTAVPSPVSAGAGTAGSGPEGDAAQER